MDSTAITTRNQSTALATTSQPLEGAEGFSQSDLRLPVWKIVQATSKMEGALKHIGEFWNSATGEYKPSFDAVVLSWKHVRSLFSGDTSDSGPECQSRDCLAGSRYGACRACQFNGEVHQELWRDAAAKRCNLGYSMTLLDPSEGTPSLFTAQKTAVGAVKMLNTTLTLKRLPLFGALCTFSAITRQEKGRQWQELKITVGAALPAADVAQYRELSQALRLTPSTQIAPSATPRSATPPSRRCRLRTARSSSPPLTRR
jgi:hypothetical protein